MTSNSQSYFVKANAAFRAKDFRSAIFLYEKALCEDDALLLKQIRFNRELALKRLSSTEQKEWLSHCRIKEIHQLKRNSNNPKIWQSLGNDPNILLASEEIFTKKNAWYYLSIEIHGSKKNDEAKLYFDHGSGFSESFTTTLPFKSGASASKVFLLQEVPKALRFDPTDVEGEFRIEYLHLEDISEKKACEIMLKQLTDADKDYLTGNSKLTWKMIQEQATQSQVKPIEYLLKRYDALFESRSETVDYQEWIESTEIPSLPSVEEVHSSLDKMHFQPLISIVMPVYNTDEIYLRACIESVIGQTYSKWELCIADDNSPKPHVRRVLLEYAQSDKRIHVVLREENGHISRASNSALEIATGDFVALLDHDDVLPAHALYYMAQAINDHPDAQVLYSDEDKIDTLGNRFDPHFKSDWNPDLFFSQNYVCHLGVYGRKLLKRISGFRVGVEGSQDQDLLLRCLPYVEPKQIIHIPRILYHWRTVEGSTALASGEKCYTTTAGIKALRDFFATQGDSSVEVEAGLVPNTYRINWPLPEPVPLVTLLIPTRDRKALTETAVLSILKKTTYPNFEIIIIDNGSVETETLNWFDEVQKKHTRVRVLPYPQPFNYSAINNFGVRHAKGSLIGLINNDIEVISPEWLTEMVSHASRPEIGCVGAKLYYTNNTIQHAGVILGIGGVAGHSHKYYKRDDLGYFSRLKVVQNLSAVTAACLIVRKDLYKKIGGLDEVNLKVAFNDVDFCLKIQNIGYRNLWTPYAELYHHESISRGSEDTLEKKKRFQSEAEYMQLKWGSLLNTDQFYNRNLSNHREDFSLCSILT